MNTTISCAFVGGAAIVIVTVAARELAAGERVTCIDTAFIPVVTDLGSTASALFGVAGIDGAFVAIIVALDLSVGPAVEAKGVIRIRCAGVERARIIVRAGVCVFASTRLGVARVFGANQAVVAVFGSISESTGLRVTRVDGAGITVVCT